MKKPNIKLIIFDFDDTLYEGESWKNWDTYKDNILHKLFTSQEDRKNFIQKYNLGDGATTRMIAKSIAEEFGSSQKFMDIWENFFYELDTKHITPMPNEFLKELSKKTKLAIVSNSSKNYLLHYLKIFNIDADNFSYILQNNYIPPLFSKEINYKLLLETENLNPDEVLVVGDNFNTDIVPAQNLGMNYLHTFCLKNVQDGIKEYISI